MQEVTHYAELFVSRWSDYARQQADGHYLRVGQPLTENELMHHLRGEITIGSYVINEQGTCKFACFDADAENGLQTLEEVQAALVKQDIASYLEASRRGGHLWVFLAQPTLASQVRSWLVPFCLEGVEFYPKQAEGRGYGSLIRLPLGVHRRSGQRYPFLYRRDQELLPAASSLLATLSWLQTVERALPPVLESSVHPRVTRNAPLPVVSQRSGGQTYQSIRAWCADQNPLTLIGRYVSLNTQGMGCCPFGEHHREGKDQHPSFRVYSPKQPGEWCWFCYTWNRGGNEFDFLRMYYGLSGKELWRRIQQGGML